MELDYAELMDNMYKQAEIDGLEHSDDAWLMIKEVWWPNPYYCGEPVAHPECDTVFHPVKTV